ncbi:ATP-binding cassette domain-containing protein [Herbiconiux ginsengi]|uniref:ABC-2 type transport system ATP-binding protein n=1 Tax=Herbiconiux ginsengi TaxID=381665 RepID=A0A1H3M0E3_9MICO|nr:ATP-binding cassette domain-containing protein [Herbiconiux ginsengi]SDY70150.1 ABC-2 type transport system ATP-binding protein [Herbiconiux ginsengi]
MPTGVPIEFARLTKSFGNVDAVSDLTLTVEPGQVTGFLGPNGAGKTTTLRMLLGLVQPSSGTATFGGTPYARLASPLATVGASLEAASFHPGRSAHNHLAVYAQAAGLPKTAPAAALEKVGLADYGSRRVGGYSLGMRQRLGLAFALLGDPAVLVLDEPINGLDPEGIKWIRLLLRAMAAEGRTVLISSHLLSEVQQTVDDVIIISHGKLVHRGELSSLDVSDSKQVQVNADDRERLAEVIHAAGYTVSNLRSGILVDNAEAAEIGRLAFDAGIAVTALSQKRTGLEESFLTLVGEEGSL